MLNYLKTAAWFFPFRVVLSIKYGLVIWLRNRLYDVGVFKTHEVKTPVISVGNVSAGGSGKTVLVQALLAHFLESGKQPAVLSRGYGRSSKGLVLVADKHEIQASLSTSGDEPFLIAKNYPGVPVVVSEDRFSGAQLLADNFAPDVIILDDGFQHRRLHRDTDIVIVDHPDKPKQHLLPWGYLREPVKNISRANVVIYSKSGARDDGVSDLVFKLDPGVQNHSKNSTHLDDLIGEYGLFAGIGKPDHFFASVETLHKPAAVKISLPDHAKYGESELSAITENSCDYWITTQKDFIKLDPAFCASNNIYFIGVKTTLPQVLLDHL